MISFDINMIVVITAIKSDGRINSANSATTSYLVRIKLSDYHVSINSIKLEE
jgi:hypothetical protein